MTSLHTRVPGAVWVAALLLGGSANAGVIPYPNAGTENPIVYSFTAASTGDVVAYFYASTAAYTNELRLLVNGVDTGIQGLNNHSSAHGASLNFGSVTAGSTLVFTMVNLSPGGIGPWYSDKSLNSDGKNHVYSTDFGGDGSIPAGTFVAFEDLPNGGDFNYNDETFVFTNVRTGGTVPEPGTLALLSFGLLGLGLARRKRK